MQSYSIPIWKTSPFCRLIVPLVTGIVIQWYQQFSLSLVLFCCAGFLTAFLLFYILPIEIKYRLQWLQGVMLLLFILCIAMFITWNNDIRHQYGWYGNHYVDSSFLLIKIGQPITEKPKSFKAEGYVQAIVTGTERTAVNGKIFIYFAKNSASAVLKYGDKIIVHKPLQRIKNSGNPGGFNYERYAAFQQVYHTVYLKPGDWQALKVHHADILNRFIFFLQEKTISVLKQYVPGDKDISGIAEALLIGYKEDLDKDLVQAYSNAGVVHIIAISGMHLGLIYVVLVWIFGRIKFVKNNKFFMVILVLASLWLFSLITGASASVLRSAVMFTCIVIGKNFFKQSSIYNSLAASAFILLSYNPYLLWDVGFQLSYLAIIGIVALQNPIGKLFYFKKGWLNKLWNMIAVTTAAQVATFPLCIYYFHQFPNLFLITNLIAVPLSTIILFAEILLIIFSSIGVVAVYIGKLTGWLVCLMNVIIEGCNKIPFSLCDNIFADVLTTWSLYVFIISACGWLVIKNKWYFRFALTGLLCFTFFHVLSKIQMMQQKKLLIYNIPGHKAIDFIYRDNYTFRGDSILSSDEVLKNFHLKPARAMKQASSERRELLGLNGYKSAWEFFGKRLYIVDTSISFLPVAQKISIDILLITNNPSIKITNLAAALQPSIIVFDASNSLWKIAGWKKECERLALPCFSIPQEGAFILEIE